MPYYPYCFREDTCGGNGVTKKCSVCDFEDWICEKLTAYEDTGLTPEQVQKLKERNTAKKQEFINGGVPVCPVC